MSTLGVDIGGANLKFADSKGTAISTAFPMWKRSGELKRALKNGAASFPHCHRLAVTMTGEMADCFANRSEGVRFIVENVIGAFKAAAVEFYTVDGGWYLSDEAIEDPISLAASNWRALAQYVAHEIDAPSILIDTGSTTTDLINLAPGTVLTQSRTDLDRLKNHELVYTGLERSNVAGLLQEINIEGRTYPIVNELFATALDAHLVLGNISPSDSCDDTADGCPRTIACAKQRIARTIGTDADLIADSLIEYIARGVVDKQLDLVSAAIQTRLRDHAHARPQIVLSGHGSIIARASLRRLQWSDSLVDLSHMIGHEASRAACAYAVAALRDRMAD
jgi:probable H4MPT-linked C1 transfer pathway protein